MKKIIKQPFFYVATASFILLLLMVCNYIFGWTTPSQAPPNANLSAPLNVSATNQSKIGKLAIGTSTPPVYTLDLYGQLKSYVAQGTAPFIVTSTTTVTNLNADLLDGYHASDIMAAGGGLKVYKSDGTTVLGNFLGCFVSPCSDGCTGIAYSDVNTGAVTVLTANDCGPYTSTTVYYGDTNCTGLAVSLTTGLVTDGTKTYNCATSCYNFYANSACTYDSYRSGGVCTNIGSTNWNNLTNTNWWTDSTCCSSCAVTSPCLNNWGYTKYIPICTEVGRCGPAKCKIK